MSGLIKQVRPILKNFSKAKAAKLVRGLVDMFLDIDRAEGSKGEAEVQLCQVQLQSRITDRSILKFRIDMRARKMCSTYILFQECIEWAKEEKRTFLRQSLESRLVGLYYETERYTDALQLGSALLKELKKLDDKNLLVEVKYFKLTMNWLQKFL